MAIGIMKIKQSAFVWDLIIEQGFTNCHINVIAMKANSFIKMRNRNDYKKAELQICQKLVGKLIYFLCNTSSDISCMFE